VKVAIVCTTDVIFVDISIGLSEQLLYANLNILLHLSAENTI